MIIISHKLWEMSVCMGVIVFSIKKRSTIFVFITLCVVSILLLLFVKKKTSDVSGIKIGLLAPLTGTYAPYGICAKNGVDLAINEINNSGGIDGKKLELIFYDDEGDPAKAVVGYNFLKGSNVSAIILGGGSSTALPVISSLDASAPPILVGTASAEWPTHASVFRIGYTNAYQGSKLSDFAKILGAKKASVLFCAEDDYSSGLKDAFVAGCQKHEITVSNIENFTMQAVDFRAQLANIKKSGSDVLLVPSYYEKAGQIVQQARELGITCPIIGGDAWNGITDYVSDKSLLNNCYYSNSFVPGNKEKVSCEFDVSYQNAYHESPTYCSAGGYDSAKILEPALLKSTRKGLKINSDDFRQDITNNLKSTDVNCIAGNVKFDDNNNSIRDAFIVRIENGEEKFYKKI